MVFEIFYVDTLTTNAQSTVVPRIKPFTVREVASVGSLVQLSCVVLEGDSPVTIRWYKNSSAYSSPSRHRRATVALAVMDDNDKLTTYNEQHLRSRNDDTDYSLRFSNSVELKKIKRNFNASVKSNEVGFNENLHRHHYKKETLSIKNKHNFNNYQYPIKFKAIDSNIKMKNKLKIKPSTIV